MTSCGDVQPYFEAFVDEELSPERTLEIEQHLGACPLCCEQVRLSGALKRATRSVAMRDSIPSPDFRKRLSEALAEERQKLERCAAAEVHRPLRWRYVAPVAAAATFVLALGVRHSAEVTSPSGARVAAASTSPEPAAAIQPERLIDELVRFHASPTDLEVTEQDALKRFEPYLGVPVRAPELKRYGARFIGASVVPVEKHRAASIHYALGGHRITVYVFDPDQVRVRRLRELELRVVNNQAVFVGHRKGYSIAAIEQRGVGYAIATDLSDRESAEIVTALDNLRSLAVTDSWPWPTAGHG